MNVSEEAIEAAARAVARFVTADRGALANPYDQAVARAALEAAAPHMQADVWEEGVEAKSEHPDPTNPYRTQP